MLGGMEDDPKVGGQPLAELAGLQFCLLSNEDTVSCKLHSCFFFSGFNNSVSFPSLGFGFCAFGEGAGGRGIRLSEKIWSFVVLWSVFLVFLGMLLSVFCGRFRWSDQNVREEPEHYRVKDSLGFPSWSVFFDGGR
jgi:hypothetical protein